MKLTEIKSKRNNKSKKDYYFGNIEHDTLSNEAYRKVLFTSANMQLVTMSIKPNEEIGMETHENGAQFVRVEKGKARFTVNKQTFNAEKDDAVIIPQGAKHNVENIGDSELKLYLIYSPPEHDENTIQKTKP